MKRKTTKNRRELQETSLNPKQILFLDYYFNPKSKAFANAYQSALLAGFKENYAVQIKAQNPTWLAEAEKQFGQEKHRRMLLKAEKNLENYLDLKPKRKEASLHKIKSDVSKFVAERIGRETYGDESKNTNQTLVINLNGASQARYQNVIESKDEQS